MQHGSKIRKYDPSPLAGGELFNYLISPLAPLDSREVFEQY